MSMHLLRIAVFFFALEKLLHASNTERLRFEQTFDVFACVDQTLSANDAFLVDQNRVGKLCDPELRPQLLRYDIVTAIDLMSGYERIVIELVTVAREGQLHVVASRDTSNDGLKFSADRAARRDEEDQLRSGSLSRCAEVMQRAVEGVCINMRRRLADLRSTRQRESTGRSDSFVQDPDLSREH
jgi:hypothetical protein